MAAVIRMSVPRIFLWILLVAGAVVCVFPFFWMLIGTTLNPNDVVRGLIIPGREFVVNLQKATKNYNVLLFLFNSTKIAVLTVILGVTVNSFAAFGFEKYRSKGRETIFAILLAALIFPQIALVIPQFKLISFLKLLNTHTAIILPSIMSVFIIFFMRQNFRMFPNEIMEAARVDGASETRIFLGIVFPSMKASFASAAIYVFIAQWNSYLWPLMIILGETQKTLPIALSSMMRAYTIEYGALMVLVSVSILPILVLFLAMQRQFVAGLLGSVK